MTHTEATPPAGIPMAECRNILNQLGGYPAKLAAIAIVTAHPDVLFNAISLAREISCRQGDEPVWLQSASGSFDTARMALEALNATGPDHTKRRARAAPLMGGRILAVDGVIMDWTLRKWDISSQTVYGKITRGAPATRHSILSHLVDYPDGLFVADLQALVEGDLGTCKPLSTNLDRFNGLGVITMENRILYRRPHPYLKLKRKHHEPLEILRDNMRALRSPNVAKKFQNRAHAIIGDDGQFDEMRALILQGKLDSTNVTVRRKVEAHAPDLSSLVLEYVATQGSITALDAREYFAKRTGKTFSVDRIRVVLTKLVEEQQIVESGTQRRHHLGHPRLVYSLNEPPN
ncbi:MAG TPA: hypothetical protein VLI54_06560 [Bacillota bacterium]|nr:hypothetical protein [Bacillota bacterium]